MQYDKILGYIKDNEEYGIQDFCELLDLKESRTKELLRALNKYIEPIGSNRNRRYRKR